MIDGLGVCPMAELLGEGILASFLCVVYVRMRACLRGEGGGRMQVVL